jgi:hypothetical protein
MEQGHLPLYLNYTRIKHLLVIIHISKTPLVTQVTMFGNMKTMDISHLLVHPVISQDPNMNGIHIHLLVIFIGQIWM